MRPRLSICATKTVKRLGQSDVYQAIENMEFFRCFSRLGNGIFGAVENSDSKDRRDEIRSAFSSLRGALATT
jgi:hypothetical protein